MGSVTIIASHQTLLGRNTITKWTYV